MKNTTSLFRYKTFYYLLSLKVLRHKERDTHSFYSSFSTHTHTHTHTPSCATPAQGLREQVKVNRCWVFEFLILLPRKIRKSHIYGDQSFFKAEKWSISQYNYRWWKMGLFIKCSMLKNSGLTRMNLNSLPQRKSFMEEKLCSIVETLKDYSFWIFKPQSMQTYILNNYNVNMKILRKYPDFNWRNVELPQIILGHTQQQSHWKKILDLGKSVIPLPPYSSDLRKSVIPLQPYSSDLG